MASEITLSEKQIKNKIHTIRSQQVMLDRDLARLYNIETRALKQAVNRNKKRFPGRLHLFQREPGTVSALYEQDLWPPSLLW